MALYSDPPEWLEFRHDKPTLLVCWWVTLFCTVIIALRVTGRFIRTERLFPEDKIAALALVPLYLRMGCVHYILRYGTNNIDYTGVDLSDQDIRRKEIASGLLLAAHVFYAATYVAYRRTPKLQATNGFFAFLGIDPVLRQRLTFFFLAGYGSSNTPSSNSSNA